MSKPCARGVSPNKTICDSSQHIRLSMSSADKLQIQCTTEVQEFPYDCDENSRINSRRHWYISTKFLSVDDPFRESICEISLEERQHHYALLFLNISVCNREKPEMNRWISSHTEDVEFHHTIHFPFIFDPAPVGATHPTPFRVTGIGLYYDELGRLALNISTIKPLNNRDCTSEVDEFKDSHRYLEFPQIPTIYKNIKL